MSTRIKLWLLPTLFYAIFVFWYTDIAGPHDYKLAALEKTIAYPIETSLYLSDPRFLLALLLIALTALLDSIGKARPSASGQ